MIGRIFLKRSLEAPAPFIVGAGRSGTTLLRAMLNAHPDLSIPPETGFIPALARLRGPKDRLRDLFIRAVTDFETVRIVDFPKEEFSRRIHAIKDFDIAAGVRAFYRMYADQSHKKRWGDKTPSYGLQMRTIERLLPEAHFIHLIRDGRDVALSTKGLWWAPGRDMAALAVHWRDTVQTIRKHGPRCRRYLEVRYEELVRD
ncbi:MAG TPA: sulfotransferase, partial [Candidatus Omnitrophota bacterium]|nr:sulfotransferase [Candidatus Omnitrophota bacterium]